MLCYNTVTDHLKRRAAMSRAFTSEQDGWGFCKLKKDECMFAGLSGTCTLSKCKFGLTKEEPDESDSEKSDK